MPRPANKSDLLKAADFYFTQVWKLIDSLSEEEQRATFQFEDRDKNIRDVLIHLYEWHQLLITWLQANINGENRPFLPEEFNWKTYPKMNLGFWEQHQQTSYEQAQEYLKKSHEEVMNIIKRFTDEELFTKQYFPWTGTTSLGSYCISSTSSHYGWAVKKLKNHKKTFKKAE